MENNNTTTQDPVQEQPEVAPTEGATVAVADSLYQLDNLLQTYTEVLEGQSQRIQDHITSHLSQNSIEIARLLVNNFDFRNNIINEFRQDQQFNASLTSAGVAGITNNPEVQATLTRAIERSLSAQIAEEASRILMNQTTAMREGIKAAVAADYTDKLAELQASHHPFQAMLRNVFGAEIERLNRTEADRVIAVQQERINRLTAEVTAAQQLQQNIAAGLVQMPTAEQTRPARRTPGNGSPLATAPWPPSDQMAAIMRQREQVYRNDTILASLNNTVAALTSVEYQSLRSRDGTRCLANNKIGKVGRYAVEGLRPWEVRNQRDWFYVHVGNGCVVSLQDIFLDTAMANVAHRAANVNDWAIRNPLSGRTLASLRHIFKQAATLHPCAPWEGFADAYQLSNNRNIPGSWANVWFEMGLRQFRGHLSILPHEGAEAVPFSSLVLPADIDTMSVHAVLNIAFAQVARPQPEPEPEPEQDQTT